MKSKVHMPYTAFKLKLAGLGVTYRDVANLLDVSVTTVQLKINGYSDFYISEQHAICQEWNIDPSIFFNHIVA